MNYFEQESERLYFRRLTENDIESWTEFFIDNPNLGYFGFDETKSHKELARDWITMQFKRYDENGCGHLAVIEKSSGNFIGLGGLIYRELDGENYYEIAYSLKPTSWNKGFGTEIAKQMRYYGTTTQLAEKFISIIHVDNKLSMHVATKNRMIPIFETVFMEMPVVVFGDE